MLPASLLCLAVAHPAGAQLRASAEFGGARVAQSRFPALAAGTAGADVDYQAGWFGVHGRGAFTMPENEPARVHSLLGATLRTSPGRRIGGELAVFGSAYHDGVFPATYATHLSGRVHARGGRAVAWAGGGFGSLDDQLHRYPLTTADVGVVTTWAGLQVTGTATWHATESEPRTELPDGRDTAVTLRDRIIYTDVALAPRYEWRAFEVGARGGLRIVHRTIAFEERRNQLHGAIDAAWWARPDVAVVMSYGRELSDLARGLPDARYLTLGVRARLRGPARRSRRATASPAVVAGSAPDVLLENGAVAGTLVRVLAAAGARQVEIAGSFTGWEPVPLTADGAGAWQLVVQLPSGPQRLMVRVDGGAWQAPANLPSLEDTELGGRVGLVTIP